MNRSRLEALNEIKCMIFREPFHPPNTARTGARILMEELGGPRLKSYWPNKVKDIINFSNRVVSSEIPVSTKTLGNYLHGAFNASSNIPISLHHIYRENIAEWRRKRGGVLKKGTSSLSLVSFIFDRRNQSHCDEDGE